MEALIPSAVGAAASQTARAHLPKPGGAGGLQLCGGAGARERAVQVQVHPGKTWKGLWEQSWEHVPGMAGSKSGFLFAPLFQRLAPLVSRAPQALPRAPLQRLGQEHHACGARAGLMPR